MSDNPANYYWDDWVLFGAQLLSLFFLVVYVIKTWQMASATRMAALASQKAVEESTAARLEAIAPRIIVYFDGDSFMAQVVVHNAGQGTAENLKLEFDPPLQSTDPKDSIAYLATVQPMIPPGYRHAQTFDTWPKYLESDLPKVYKVTATYSGAENRKQYSVTYTLDAEVLRWRHIMRRDVEELTDELEKLRKAIPDSITKLHQEMRPLYWLSSQAFDVPDEPKEAVQNILGLWELLRTLQGEKNVLYSRKGLAELMRRDLLALARKLAVMTPLQRDAVSNAVKSFFTYQSDYLGTDAWSDDAPQNAITELAAAFGIAPSPGA